MNILTQIYNLIFNKSDCCGKPIHYWGKQGYCDKENGGCGKRDF